MTKRLEIHFYAGLFSAAAALTLLPVTAAAAPSCAGNACGALKLDAANCMFKNVSTEKIKLSIKEVSDFEISMQFDPGMERKAQKPFGGCFNPAKVESYTVNFLGAVPAGADPRTGKEISVEMGFTEPHGCSGNGCSEAEMIESEGCVWLNYRGRAPAKAQVQFGTQLVTVELKPAIFKPKGSIQTPLPGPGKEECSNAWRAERSLNLIRQRGLVPFVSPEHTKTLKECGPEGGVKPAAEEAPADGSGKYVKKYDALSHTEYSHYRAKIAGPAGCAKALNEVGAFSVNSN